MNFQDLEEFDFDLPEEQIARFPEKKRDHSRLMVLEGRKIDSSRKFHDIIHFLREGDVLVRNATRVSKRRVFLVSQKNRRHEALFLEELEGGKWKCMLRGAKKLKPQEMLKSERGEDYTFTFLGREEDSVLLLPSVRLSDSDFERIGEIPIPPYLRRSANSEDSIRYQTVFAGPSGSVAAPTAGLHFTLDLERQLRVKGVEILDLILEIGYGTFQPLDERNFAEKKLHSERYELTKEVASRLNLAKEENRRILALGTTSLRVLESTFEAGSATFRSGNGETNIFLAPGDPIHSIDGLITNFHLPKSSLILLVAAFAGKDIVISAYQRAVSESFRFYSYGDAMLLLRNKTGGVA